MSTASLNIYKCSVFSSYISGSRKRVTFQAVKFTQSSDNFAKASEKAHFILLVEMD